MNAIRLVLSVFVLLKTTTPPAEKPAVVSLQMKVMRGKYRDVLSRRKQKRFSHLDYWARQQHTASTAYAPAEIFPSLCGTSL